MVRGKELPEEGGGGVCVGCRLQDLKYIVSTFLKNTKHKGTSHIRAYWLNKYITPQLDRKGISSLLTPIQMVWSISQKRLVTEQTKVPHVSRKDEGFNKDRHVLLLQLKERNPWKKGKGVTGLAAAQCEPFR